MPRKYKRKKGAKKRKPLDCNKLNAAVLNVINDGASYKSTAKRYDVNVRTLKRSIIGQRFQENEISYSSNYRKSQIFRNEEEMFLKDYLDRYCK